METKQMTNQNIIDLIDVISIFDKPAARLADILNREYFKFYIALKKSYRLFTSWEEAEEYCKKRNIKTFYIRATGYELKD